jgi:hypothetical protein
MTGVSTYRHEHEIDDSVRSAARVVPKILDAVGPVRSVADVGGGTGVWLREFLARGATSGRLYDAPAVRPLLVVDPDCFEPCDLSREIPRLPPVDLAVCLECAEHLPAAQAGPLVERLTAAAGVVVFSAAVPWQGGTGHVNEQPADYWQRLFAARGFRRYDVIRGKIIRDPGVAYWYRQNLFVYARDAARLTDPADLFLPDEFHLVHQSVLDRYVGPPGLRTMARHFLPQLVKAVTGRLGGGRPAPAPGPAR